MSWARGILLSLDFGLTAFFLLSPTSDELQGVSIEMSAVVIMKTLFGFTLGTYFKNLLIEFAFIAGFGIALILMVVYVLRERR